MTHHFLFDYDGVLTQKIDFATSVSNKHGVEEAKLRWFFQTYLQDLLRGNGDMIALLEEHLVELNWTGSSRALFEAIYLDSHQLNGDMIELIRERLYPYFSCHIATNQDHHRFQLICKEPLRAELFDHVFSSSEFGVAKPELGYFERIYAYLLERDPDLQKDQITFIDDLQENVDAAAIFGFHAHCYKLHEDFLRFLDGHLLEINCPLLEGDHVLLRNMQLADAQGYSDILSDEETYRFLTESGLVDKAQARQKIIANQQATQEGRSIYWSITGEDAEFLGFLAIHSFQAETAAISYGIHPAHRRKGIASAALKRVLAWEEIENKTVQMATHLDNQASFEMLSRMDVSYLGVMETRFGQRHVFERIP